MDPKGVLRVLRVQDMRRNELVAEEVVEGGVLSRLLLLLLQWC